MFSFLLRGQKIKGKQEKSKLSVLCVSAVNNSIQTKAHLREPFVYLTVNAVLI
jgi:hypothetical protein